MKEVYFMNEYYLKQNPHLISEGFSINLFVLCYLRTEALKA